MTAATRRSVGWVAAMALVAQGVLLAASGVSAPGAPAATGAPGDEGRAPAGVSGIVLSEEGAPVPDATVALVPSSGRAFVLNGALVRDVFRGSLTQTGSDGRFSFDSEGEDYTLVALHEEGVAEVQGEELPQSGEVQLSRWGALQGDVLHGKEIARRAAAAMSEFGGAWRDIPVRYVHRPELTEDGRLGLSRVVPGRYHVDIQLDPGGGAPPVSRRHVVRVEAGTKARLVSGGRGRAVVGSVGSPVGGDPPARGVRYSGQVHLEMRPVLLPTELEAASRQEQREWYTEWRQSGQEADHWLAGVGYSTGLLADGTFRIEDVLPDEYDLLVSFTASAGAVAGRRAVAEARVVVEPVDAGADGPVDVGALDSEVLEPMRLGRPAPEFGAFTVDGELVRLSDFRGGLVLLDFWATWCAPCHGETPYLKAVHEEFGGERLTIIGLSQDSDPEAPRRYAQEKGLGWLQCYTNYASSVSQRYGVTGIPMILLIGPEGQVLEGGLRGPRIRAAVQSVLADE
jgi:peroxiredoxin